MGRGLAVNRLDEHTRFPVKRVSVDGCQWMGDELVGVSGLVVVRQTARPEDIGLDSLSFPTLGRYFLTARTPYTILWGGVSRYSRGDPRSASSDPQRINKKLAYSSLNY